MRADRQRIAQNTLYVNFPDTFSQCFMLPMSSYGESYPDGVSMSVTPARASDSGGARITLAPQEPVVGATDRLTLETFILPRLLLHTGERVTVEGFQVQGRNATMPTGSLQPPIGLDRQTLGTTQVELHPDVILVPVHVRVLVDPLGGLSSARHAVAGAWLDEDFVRAVFDPGLTGSFGTHSDSYSSGASVATTLQPAQLSPDPIYTQCNVQFRLVSYRHVRQSYALHDHVFENDVPVLPEDLVPSPADTATNIARVVYAERQGFLNAAGQPTGIGIYIVGKFENPTGANTGTGAGYTASRFGSSAIYINNAAEWFGKGNTFIHELAHLLTGDSRHYPYPSVLAIDSSDNRYDGTVIGPEQCASIRFNAAGWSYNAGWISQARRDEIRNE